jgi:hypothetical protein
MLISWFLGKHATRVEMGLPSNWRRVEDWLYFSGPVAYVAHEDPKKKDSEWPDIPVLEDYSKPPSADFWSFFPSRPLPTTAETSINISELERDIESKKNGMTCHQYERCLRTVDYLRNGAPSFQSSDLPGCFVKNSASTIPNGKEVTENIATWVREGGICGGTI